ncbi:hypothetical protein KKF84_16155 [Myxococcota bacterium]|nr:hypothetical protein [Myxococcota bacterium]MBU1536859.1 hypothetical protein [Myxococcota bacterium]
MKILTHPYNLRALCVFVLSLFLLACANGSPGEEEPCGNGSLDNGEDCDDTYLGNSTCISLGYYGGALGCHSDCTFNLNTCEATGRCGDGVLHSMYGEACDSQELGTETCDSLGYDGGTLACADDCTFDTSGCQGAPQCGDNLAEGEEQCDGTDLADCDCESLGLGGGTLACDESCAFDTTGCDTQPVCGDGETQSPMEGCDDNGTSPGDGCAADCTVESGWTCDDSSPSVCLRIPDMPVIDGEPSAGHDAPVWLWNSPVGTDHFMFRLDGGSFTQTIAQQHTAAGLTEGLHTLEVAACNSQGGCSPAASFDTTVEYFGAANPLPWQGVARANLATTAIGNVVPLSCHNCYNGPSNEVFNTAGALSKIHSALTNGADLIELDIADAQGTLCVYHGDLASCGGSPALPEMLADSTLAASSAMLFIELKEGDMAPDDFAVALLDLFNSHREFVKNGRPIFFRAFNSKLNYLQAISNHLTNYPLIAPYIRFSVLYGKNAIADVSQFQTEIAAIVAGNQFHLVEFDYRQKHLPGLRAYARAQGVGTGVYTIPGSFGEAFIAGLRDEVDQITAEYRIDLARQVVEDTNTWAYINTSGCTSAADPAVSVLTNTGAGLTSSAIAVGTLPTGLTTGTPPLHFDPQGEDRYGCSLDYRSSAGITERAINLGSHPPQSAEGFLVTTYLNFDTLASLTGTMAVMNSAEAGGFALELYNDGSTVWLRFGVRVGGTYVYHTYNIAATGLSAPNASINGADGYFLVGAYDGNGGVYLWVDNELGGISGNTSGGVEPSGQPTLLGADPQPGSDLNARFYFDGLIQSASVQAWGDHPYSGSNVNE